MKRIDEIEARIEEIYELIEAKDNDDLSYEEYLELKKPYEDELDKLRDERRELPRTTFDNLQVWSKPSSLKGRRVYGTLEARLKNEADVKRRADALEVMGYDLKHYYLGRRAHLRVTEHMDDGISDIKTHDIGERIPESDEIVAKVLGLIEVYWDNSYDIGQMPRYRKRTAINKKLDEANKEYELDKTRDSKDIERDELTGTPKSTMAFEAYSGADYFNELYTNCNKGGRKSENDNNLYNLIKEVTTELTTKDAIEDLVWYVQNDYTTRTEEEVIERLDKKNRRVVKTP